MSIIDDKHRISIILALLLPGAGHIYNGSINKGIKIAISFVISIIIFANILPQILIPILVDISNELMRNNTELISKVTQYFFGIIYGLGLIPPFIIWIKQIKDLIKYNNK